MADFNPDQYLAEKTGAASSGGGGFDPDKYLKEKAGGGSSEKSSWLDTKLPFNTSARGLVQGTLNTLPTVGMIGGGAAGTAAGPLGIVGAAGLGAGMGEGLKQLGERTILGKDPQNLKQSAETAAKSVQGGMEGEMGGKALGGAAKMVSENPIVQKGAAWIGNKASKLGEMLTGVSKQDIQTYAKNAEEIKHMASESDGSVPEAADQMRDKWMKGVQEAKGELNNQISKALENEGNKTIDSKPIIDAMEAHKARLNPKLTSDVKDIGDIDDLIKQAKGLASENGTITAKDANDLRRNLQATAQPAYGKSGQIFQYGEQSQQAAKKGAAQVRQLLNKEIPDIADANNKLAQFHDLEDDMNKNLLASGKPEAAVLSAGSGANTRNAMNLSKLGKLSDQDMVGDAQKLSSMRTFTNPHWLPVDNTGKSLTRVGAGTALGAAAGYGIGGEHGAMVGAGVGGGLTSPAMLKAAIDSGIGIKGLLSQPDVYNAVVKGLLQKQAESRP